MNVFGYWYSDKFAVRANRAQPVEPSNMRRSRSPRGLLILNERACQRRDRPRAMLALALVVAAVGALGAGCGGGGTATEASGAEELSKAISRYTGLSPGEADAIAISVRSTSAGALAALTRAVDEQPPLPSGASVATGLETIGHNRGFDGDGALADLCEAILDEPSPQPSVRLDPVSAVLMVRWSEDGPALQLGRAIHRASVRVLERSFNGARYSASFLEEFEDMLVEEATSGVPERSDPNEVLLWLRLQQLRSAACA